LTAARLIMVHANDTSNTATIDFYLAL